MLGNINKERRFELQKKTPNKNRTISVKMTYLQQSQLPPVRFGMKKEGKKERLWLHQSIRL